MNKGNLRDRVPSTGWGRRSMHPMFGTGMRLAKPLGNRFVEVLDSAVGGFVGRRARGNRLGWSGIGGRRRNDNNRSRLNRRERCLDWRRCRFGFRSRRSRLDRWRGGTLTAQEPSHDLFPIRFRPAWFAFRARPARLRRRHASRTRGRRDGRLGRPLFRWRLFTSLSAVLEPIRKGSDGHHHQGDQERVHATKLRRLPVSANQVPGGLEPDPPPSPPAMLSRIEVSAWMLRIR